MNNDKDVARSMRDVPLTKVDRELMMEDLLDFEEERIEEFIDMTNEELRDAWENLSSNTYVPDSIS